MSRGARGRRPALGESAAGIAAEVGCVAAYVLAAFLVCLALGGLAP